MNYRIGHGFDRHRLEDGNGVVLGGVSIECGKETIALSDGDVLLHAVTDAIYSAIGDGDIGTHFPNTDKGNKDAASSLFLAHALERSKSLGFSIVNVSATIICDEPKIADVRNLINASVSAMLGAPVHVQGKTTESCQTLDAIDVHAVALLLQGTCS